MTGRLILLTDLDDTLFASERSLPDGATRAHMAAVDGDGQPLSYQTPQQQRIWSLFSEQADIIVPVTGRTSYALDRVNLTFKADYAVVSHGALLLHNGQLLPAWQEHLAPQQAAAQANITQARRALTEILEYQFPGVVLSLRELSDLEVPVYLSIKAPESLPHGLHQALHDVAAAHDLTLHMNRRNAALRPAYTCKAATCDYLLEQVLNRQPEDTVIALGDSLSDLKFMAASDMTVIPTRSQIWHQLKGHAQ
ncbi:hypothetical protein [Cobetia sp. QF-1]|uniref:hypothetical protein n=1 Tax=Cobetia sp. QF-1 TaxID=1969833 RepID=UPI000B53E568|nr:hypothetical protein [Cobetia sp. QF-1]